MKSFRLVRDTPGHDRVAVCLSPPITRSRLSTTSKKPLKLKGKVTEMSWANPHAWIYIEVVGKNGKVEKWAWETGGANALYRRGWRKEDLVAGTVLVIDGFQARNGIQYGQRDEHHLRGRQAPVRRLLISKQRHEVKRGLRPRGRASRPTQIPEILMIARCNLHV